MIILCEPRPETLSLPLLQEADAPSLAITSSSSAFHISIVKVLLIPGALSRAPGVSRFRYVRYLNRFSSVPLTAVVSHIAWDLSSGLSSSFANSLNLSARPAVCPILTSADPCEQFGCLTRFRSLVPTRGSIAYFSRSVKGVWLSFFNSFQTRRPWRCCPSPAPGPHAQKQARGHHDPRPGNFWSVLVHQWRPLYRGLRGAPVVLTGERQEHPPESADDCLCDSPRIIPLLILAVNRLIQKYNVAEASAYVEKRLGFEI